MSEMGHFRKSASVLASSAVTSIADIKHQGRHVRNVPRPDLVMRPLADRRIKSGARTQLPKIGLRPGKIAGRYRWACARTPRSRPELALIGMIASTPTWR